MANGIPNNPTYGGQIYSSLFGMQECSDNDLVGCRVTTNGIQPCSTAWRATPSFRRA